jgi:hypothetical protein
MLPAIPLPDQSISGCAQATVLKEGRLACPSRATSKTAASATANPRKNEATRTQDLFFFPRRVFSSPFFTYGRRRVKSIRNQKSAFQLAARLLFLSLLPLVDLITQSSSTASHKSILTVPI